MLLLCGSGDDCESAEAILRRDDFVSRFRLERTSSLPELLAALVRPDEVAAVLLLWHEDDEENLVAAVDAARNALRDSLTAIIVRATRPLSRETRDRLWDFSLADRLYTQSVRSAELADSVASALRNHLRVDMYAGVSESASRLLACRNLNELASLALAMCGELGRSKEGGCFGFFREEGRASLLLLLGTGRYADIHCLTVGQLPDVRAREIIRATCDAGVSRFDDESAALCIETANGHRAVIYLTLPAPLTHWRRHMLEALAKQIANAIDNIQLNQRLNRVQRATITTLATTAEHRDMSTGDHVQRVARMTAEIAQVMFDRGLADGLSEAELDRIPLASVLHDVGKIGVSDTVLFKPGLLDADERRAIELHAVYGADILDRAAGFSAQDGHLFRMAAVIARHHHEQFDGNGYPDGLRGAEIPLAARIVAVSDVYDALTTKRPYKEAWPSEKAVALIRDKAGTQFDPVVVEAFLTVEELTRSANRIDWTEDLSVADDEMDQDHRQLIDIINRLSMAEALGNRQVIEFVLEDLVRYTQYHFQREEQLMEKLLYPGREQHRKIHHGIRSRLEEIRWEYLQGMRSTIQKDLLEFLSVWLSNHILKEDMRYGSSLARA